MIIKILYDVIKERVFLISLLVTWAKTNVLIKGDVTISGVTIEGVDCISCYIKMKLSIYCICGSYKYMTYSLYNLNICKFVFLVYD